MGNGLPIAGIDARREVVADFGRKARYFNTFGGNPKIRPPLPFGREHADVFVDVLADLRRPAC
jgi:4-aminobutyrate aminotransferase-like enzyme